MSRTMPSVDDYAAAVRNPGLCFSDDALCSGAVQRHELGRRSVVFQLTSSDGSRHAVKCFTREEPRRLPRYERIFQGLTALKPRWAAEFAYLEDGIRVGGEMYPVLRMDWVEGMSLLTWLREHQDATEIARLAAEFDRLIRELAGAGIAHGDLRPGNILVQPDGTLRLIDYDAMYVPGVGLGEYPPDETGHPDHRPPGRTEPEYGPDADRFAAWLISLSLHALAADPSLLDSLPPGGVSACCWAGTTSPTRGTPPAWSGWRSTRGGNLASWPNGSGSC